MAEGGKDDSEKTEEPTQKRLEEALKKGQVYQSREVNSLFILFTFAMILAWGADSVFRSAANNMAQFIQRPESIPVDASSLGDVLEVTVANVAITMSIPMLAFVAAVLLAGFGQKPLTISTDPIKPKLEKISIPKGIKRMFSMRSITEFLKGIFKISVVGFVAFWVVWPRQQELQRLPNTDLGGLMDFLKDSAVAMLIGVITVVFFIALLDYFYQRFEYMKNLRMSKQDIKDEYKQQEGDPMVKNRLRQIRMERAQKRMMANVPGADVIITNPTHYAVALKYNQGNMAAPEVVAKGKDKVAFRIRDVADKNDIPIVENPPLARALFTVDVEDEVPLEHYKAVAEIISYVYKLKGKKL
ncbi:MAG: flagellar biosynthesis protein FlhB [Rickettsiales bacterium]|nr:flagellar biosynthesis protein FlhB [Rickettsiales bacterium]